MKESLEKLRLRLREERPAAWDNMPDLALYMDQALSYMPRQLIHLGETDTLTAAMVNNYIKDGLMPRAEGKKYTRVHLAYLTAICTYKQVLSVKDTHRLLQCQLDALMPDTPADEGIALLYSRFVREMDCVLSETAERLPDGDASREQIAMVAFQMALQSYASKLACQQLLDLLLPEEPSKKAKKKKEK